MGDFKNEVKKLLGIDQEPAPPTTPEATFPPIFSSLYNLVRTFDRKLIAFPNEHSYQFILNISFLKNLFILSKILIFKFLS